MKPIDIPARTLRGLTYLRNGQKCETYLPAGKIFQVEECLVGDIEAVMLKIEPSGQLYNLWGDTGEGYTENWYMGRVAWECRGSLL
jgi:hypothetical protein|tara:strand:+ start:2178 stop:2435 length:258 start_codon:yes stop_codon:yes gene_type:complete